MDARANELIKLGKSKQEREMTTAEVEELGEECLQVCRRAAADGHYFYNGIATAHRYTAEEARDTKKHFACLVQETQRILIETLPGTAMSEAGRVERYVAYHCQLDPTLKSFCMMSTSGGGQGRRPTDEQRNSKCVVFNLVGNKK